jgi:hypothetical protein
VVVTVLKDNQVNVLQAINLTLGTSAFLGLADSLSKLIDFKHDYFGARIAFALLIAAWSIKLLAENHRSFLTQNVENRPRYAVFQLVMAVGMFLCLTVSAKNASDLILSSSWLAGTMLFGVIWLVGLAIFHMAAGQFQWQKYPWHWLISALASFSCCFWISYTSLGFSSVFSQLLISAMVAALVIDFKISNSFS